MQEPPLPLLHLRGVQQRLVLVAQVQVLVVQMLVVQMLVHRRSQARRLQEVEEALVAMVLALVQEELVVIPAEAEAVVSL